MSENQSRSARDFSKYDAMETQELEAILRLDAESPEGQESDTECILYIAEVLAKRKNVNNTGKTALEAWEAFQKNYLPAEQDSLECTQKKIVKTPRFGLHRLIAAAAVIALLVGLSVSVSAFGWQDIWNTVARWAKGTFSFVGDGDSDRPEPEGRSVQQYTSLQEALTAADQSFDLIPTWIPDGYELKGITVYEVPTQHVYIAHYKNGEKSIAISLRSFIDADPEIVEINDNLQEVYKADGVEYYIFFNDKQLRALWQVDSYECYISGELTMEEIKTMIDSNGKG